MLRHRFSSQTHSSDLSPSDNLFNNNSTNNNSSNNSSNDDHLQNSILCYIKYYLKIFLIVFLIHVCLVQIHNKLKIPDTCQIAKLSGEKLALFNSIVRDDIIDYNIPISNTPSMDDNKKGNDNIIDGETDHKESSNRKDNSSTQLRQSKQKGKQVKNTSESMQHFITNMKKEPFVPILPKIIHHQWKDDSIPTKYVKWYDQWRIYFPEPEYKYILWTDESARDLIKTHYPWFLETYDNYDMNIKRADASRYFILHHMGGMYADLDYEPLENFYEYLPQNQVGLIESPYLYNEKTQNSFMTSPKADPFWIHVFQGLAQSAHRSVLHATGPKFLDAMMDSSNHPIYTLPCENFHRIPYGELKESKWTAIVVREFLTRIIPLRKHCGYYQQENSCQFGKHHNAASWTSESFF